MEGELRCSPDYLDMGRERSDPRGFRLSDGRRGSGNIAREAGLGRDLGV